MPSKPILISPPAGTGDQRGYPSLLARLSGWSSSGGSEPAEVLAKPIRITVRGGYHSGATAVVDGGQATVGSGLDSDIVLADTGVASVHARITRRKSLLLPLADITALADDVTVGERRLNAGDRVPTFLPCEVTLGGARITVAADGGSDRLDLASVGAMVLAAVLIGGIVGLVIPSMTSARLTQLAWPTAAHGPVVPASATVEPATPYEGHIRKAGLDGKVRASLRGRAYVFRGSLTPEEHAKWLEVKQVMAADGIDPNTIVDLVGVTTTVAVPKGLVAAVLRQPVPTVIGSDGSRARVGERLSDGWLIVEIGAESVVIERGQQRARVPL